VTDRAPRSYDPMTHTYSITVPAKSELDAPDWARRRAREDGYRTKTTKRVVRVSEGVYAVTLAVTKL
jgi:hypothetical protein